MATVYFWENNSWHKLATYTAETARKVISDLLMYHLLGVFDMCAVDTETGEVIASNTLSNL